MTGNLKKSVSQSAGVNGLFESITIMSGDGNTIYETLDSYGLKAGLYYFYTKIASNHLRELHEGKPENVVFGFNSANMYCDGIATTKATAHKKVSVHLPLYCVGCLTPLREKVFPLIATAGLRIRIVLASSTRALQVIKCPVGVAAGVGDVPVRDENLTINNQGGYNVNFQCDVTTGSNDITLDRQIDGNRATFANVNRALLWSKTKTAEGAPQFSHPFLVDQSIVCNGNGAAGSVLNQTRKITEIKQDVDGKIVLTVDGVGFTRGGAVGVGNGYALRVDASPTTNNEENYELSNVNMTISYAVASPEYLSAVQQSVASGKMVIDIHTSTNYTENIATGSMQNTMYIKSVNNRCKALTCIPIKVNSQNSFLEDSYQPDQQNIKNYQMVLYNVLCPNLEVRVDRFQKENGDSKASFSGVGIKEMSHALTAVGYPVNNLFGAWRSFFIGRALTLKPGYTYNGNQSGDMRLNVAYDSSAVQSTLWYNTMHHIRRININGNQQTVTL